MFAATFHKRIRSTFEYIADWFLCKKVELATRTKIQDKPEIAALLRAAQQPDFEQSVRDFEADMAANGVYFDGGDYRDGQSRTNAEKMRADRTSNKRVQR